MMNTYKIGKISVWRPSQIHFHYLNCTDTVEKLVRPYLPMKVYHHWSYFKANHFTSSQNRNLTYKYAAWKKGTIQHPNCTRNTALSIFETFIHCLKTLKYKYSKKKYIWPNWLCPYIISMQDGSYIIFDCFLNWHKSRLSSSLLQALTGNNVSELLYEYASIQVQVCKLACILSWMFRTVCM